MKTIDELPPIIEIDFKPIKESLFRKLMNYKIKKEINSIYSVMNKKTKLEKSFKEWRTAYEKGDEKLKELITQERINPELEKISRFSYLLQYQTKEKIEKYSKNPSKQNMLEFISHYRNSVLKLIALKKINPPINYWKCYQRNVLVNLEKIPKLKKEILKVGYKIQNQIRYLETKIIWENK